MRTLILSLICAAAASGATCTLSGTANLSAATWNCGHTPTTSDTAVLNGYVLTADQNWTFGTGTPGTVLTIGTGKLVINSGVTVTIYGDVVHAVVSAANYFIDSTSGSTISIAGVVGASASGKSGTWRCRSATITSTGTFNITDAYSNSNLIDWDSCSISNFGVSGAYAVNYGWWVGPIKLTHNTFSNSTEISVAGPYNSVGQPLTVMWNAFINPVVTASCPHGMPNFSFTSKVDGNGDEVSYNYFSTSMGSNLTCGGGMSQDMTNAVMTGNYFADGPTIPGKPPITDSYFRESYDGYAVGTGASVSTSFVVQDNELGNPHGVIMNMGGTASVNGLICFYTGVWVIDTGACVEPMLGTVVTAANVLALPGHDGQASSGNVFQPFSNSASEKLNATHTTGVSTGTFFFGYSHSIGEGQSYAYMGTFRDNFVYSPGNANWWFALDSDQYNVNSGCAPYSTTSSTIANVGPNFGWPQTTNNAEAGSCNTNSANGWGGKWSSTPPGVANVFRDPMFGGATRSPLTFPARYLNRTPTNGVWNSGTAYTQGQTVTATDSTLYAGTEAILFRCAAAAGCPAGGPKPGVGANWRNTWEYEVNYELRTQVPAATTYVDGSLVLQGDTACTAAAPCTIIRAMYNWVQLGWAPNNPALWSAGSDGKSPGSVDMSVLGPAMVAAITQ